jgi:hypothetical protein
MNFFRNEYSGRQEEVFAGIVHDMQGVEYTLKNGRKVGAEPEQSGVDVSSQYFQLT